MAGAEPVEFVEAGSSGTWPKVDGERPGCQRRPCDFGNIGDDTPETGTPQGGTRSVSPCSDEGASVVRRCQEPLRLLEGKSCREAEVAGSADDARDATTALAAACSAEKELSCEVAVDSEKSGSRRDRKHRCSKPSAAASAVAAYPALPLDGGAPDPFFLFQSDSRVQDRNIIRQLAASQEMRRRLLRTAQTIPQILKDDDGVNRFASSLELYGSLSLEQACLSKLESKKGETGMKSKSADEAVSDYSSVSSTFRSYVNEQSDVDFVVEMRPGVAPQEIVQHIINTGTWRRAGEVHVHKFSSTQFTLVGSPDPKEDADCEATEQGGDREGSPDRDFTQEVYLDITCIESPSHFVSFKKRQEAFREVFFNVRLLMKTNYGDSGGVAFDAYIHMLKAFAAKLKDGALTCFQAKCIGLFTLQIGYYNRTPLLSLAESLIQGFLHFCVQFYGDWYNSKSSGHQNYKNWAIDVSGGKWLKRKSKAWRSEIYFMAVEGKLGNTRASDMINVAHSLEPALVAKEAQERLFSAFPVTAQLPT